MHINLYAQMAYWKVDRIENKVAAKEAVLKVRLQHTMYGQCIPI